MASFRLGLLFLALLLQTPQLILARNPSWQPRYNHRSQGVITTVPATAALGPSVVQFTSNASGLDGPKVLPVNGSVFDWWYFDVASSDGLSNVVVIFFTLPFVTFPFVAPDDIVSVAVQASFPDGTSFRTSLLATEAVIMTVGDGSEGRYEGANASWWGSPDMERYGVKIDAPEAGVVGTMKLKSVRIEWCRADPASVWNKSLKVV